MPDTPRRPSLAEWTKLLQRRLGYPNAFEFASQMHLSRNTIALIQSGKRAEPSLPTARALLHAAAAVPDLLTNAPAIFEGLGLLDPGMVTDTYAMKGYTTKTKDSAVVAEDIDEIEDGAIRRRARNAALRAVDEVRTGADRPDPPNGAGPKSERKSGR